MIEIFRNLSQRRKEQSEREDMARNLEERHQLEQCLIALHFDDWQAFASLTTEAQFVQACQAWREPVPHLKLGQYRQWLASHSEGAA